MREDSKGGWDLHPRLVYLFHPITAGTAEGRRRPSCFSWSQTLNDLPHPPPQPSSAFGLSSPSVDSSGGMAPLHTHGPYLSSLLRDLGFLMDDHLGH